MEKAKLISRIIFVIISGVACFLIGALIGGSIVTRQDGLAGPAIVFWYAIIGLIAGIILGIILNRKISRIWIIRVNLLVGVFVLGWIVYLTLQVRQKKKDGSTELPGRRETTVPAPSAPKNIYHLMGAVEYNGQYLDPNYQLPVGIGVADPEINPNRPLYLYSRPKMENHPSMEIPVDSITFFKEREHVNISTAPPYLVPEALKTDYDVFFFRAVAISRNWIKVIVNNTTGQTVYLNRFETNFSGWPEFLSEVYSVERTDPETNPVRLKPLDHAAVVVRANNVPLKVISAEGDWLMVTTEELGPGIPSYGFIRWRKCDEFLVRYSLFS